MRQIDNQPLPAGARADQANRSPAQELLAQLLASSLILAEDWEALAAPVRAKLLDQVGVRALLSSLREERLLTEYQAGRIEAGTMHGLVLGNYRVVDRIGAGGTGAVFKAEHKHMRRPVAVKVLPMFEGQNQGRLLRLFTEMRAVAQLQHPNIVAAIDAGEIAGDKPGDPILHYFVMEYVPGQDLEQYVSQHGPLPLPTACSFAYQIASALAEAHKHNLVHRDIKPSNVLVTAEEQAKLLDFGLARHFRHRQTVPGALLGTIDYMAPEQIQDADAVDIRTDIYALGANLYRCLAAKPPFSSEGTLAEFVTRRLQQAAPSIRGRRSDIPIELDEVLSRMMAMKPEDRYPSPQAVMHALLPFLKSALQTNVLVESAPGHVHASLSADGSANEVVGHQILIVDDEPSVRTFCRLVLEPLRLRCVEASDGERGLEAALAQSFDLVLLDIDMPKIRGPEVLRRLRKRPLRPHLKVIMFSGRASPDEMAGMLAAGADGYLTKPFSIVQLSNQVNSALRLKDSQDRSDLLNRRLMGINSELERTLSARDSDLVHARNALVLALAQLVKHRDGETGAHVWRLQRYSRCLATEATALPIFASQIDANFIDLIECCAPLHDIGKVGIPDHILLKPGKLTSEERILMQSHTLIGAETLTKVAEHHGSAMAFLQMAIDIARHHHERYDGAGYPDRLAGADIPLAARIVAIGDVYDALCSRRSYKPALSHAAALQIMTEGSPGHFDPALLPAFHRCADEFDKIFQELVG